MKNSRHARLAQESAPIGDRVEHTTCYMCACRCGINVHIKDGNIRYIEGNPNHPVNKGVLCAKGSAGIMHQYSPARLTKPLRRVGERGSGEFREIEWDEALDTATAWLATARATNPRKLAFFTGRDQSQAFTSWWAKQFGTPNYAAHGGFCSVNMAAAGIYTIGSAFWEFGEPDWDRTRYFMMFGVAEDHGSNPIKMGIAKLRAQGGKFVSVNPVQTGYSAVADQWLGIRPGRDGLFVMALIHELLHAGKVDLDYVQTYTNGPWLIIDDPGADDHGLAARDNRGLPYVWDLTAGVVTNINDAEANPALSGTYRLPDGRTARPSFQLLAERYMDAKYAPEQVAHETGLEAAAIRQVAAELARAAFEEEIVLDIPWTDYWGRRHDKTIGRPVSFHAMRGISAHSNGFQTCRAIHILQLLLGSIDVPGGFLHKPPYPKSMGFLPRPSGRDEEVEPNNPLPGPHLGFPTWPEHLLVDENNQPKRLDKAFSWDAPLAAHGMMHAVITNAWKGDPYPIDTLFMYMANMAWNSSMNTAETIAMLTDKDAETGQYKIPHIIYCDAFSSEMTAYADLILPDTTYLERWDCISLLDRPISEPEAVCDAIRQPVLPPLGESRPFQTVLLELGARLGLAGMIDGNGEPKYPGGYADYLVRHERLPGMGSLAGWRGIDGEKNGLGPVNPAQIERYIENECFWREEIPPEARYYRHANLAYLEYARSMGFIATCDPIPMNLYCEELQRFRLAGEGHGPVQPPAQKRDRIVTYFDPIPAWYPPLDEEAAAAEAFPLHAITQRPMPMYHSWGSQNGWLRQIYSENALYIHRGTAREKGIADGDWVWVKSRHAKIKVRARLMTGVNRDTVWTWNAIGKRRGAWNLDENAPEAAHGFLLNHLIDDLLPPGGDGYAYSNSDPLTGQAAWYDLRVSIERAEDQTAQAEPQFNVLRFGRGGQERPSVLRYGASFRTKP